MTDVLWKGDLLQRDKLAERLETIVRTYKSGAAISIEGDFGSGKTYLLTNFERHLRASGLATVYFNAWESDFVENPLLVLMGDILGELRRLAPEGQTDRMKRAAKELWPLLARVAAKSVLRAGAEDLDKLLGPLDEEVDRIFSDRAEGPLTRHDLARARSALDVLIATAKDERPGAFPLVVLVDELDRANPDWVITCLESIKHLFAQEHIVFVVANDRSTLDVLLRHRFGAAYDVDGYLSKFFNHSIGIQVAEKDGDFLRARLIDMGLVADGLFDDDRDVFGGLGPAVSGCLFGLGGATGKFRRLERCADRLGLCARGMNGNGWSFLLGLLVGLYVSDRALFKVYVGGLRGPDAVDKLKARVRTDSDQWMIQWAIACAVAPGEWHSRRNWFGSRVGVDQLPSVDEIVRSIESRISAHRSAAQWTMEKIGWQLS